MQYIMHTQIPYYMYARPLYVDVQVVQGVKLT